MLLSKPCQRCERPDPKGLLHHQGFGWLWLRDCNYRDVVDCKTCAELLSTYRHAAKSYADAQERFQALLRDDFKLAWQELKRLREACKTADEALIAHWRKEHTDLAEKAGAS